MKRHRPPAQASADISSSSVSTETENADEQDLQGNAFVQDRLRDAGANVDSDPSFVASNVAPSVGKKKKGASGGEDKAVTVEEVAACFQAALAIIDAGPQVPEGGKAPVSEMETTIRGACEKVIEGTRLAAGDMNILSDSSVLGPLKQVKVFLRAPEVTNVLNDCSAQTRAMHQQVLGSVRLNVDAGEKAQAIRQIQEETAKVKSMDPKSAKPVDLFLLVMGLRTRYQTASKAEGELQGAYNELFDASWAKADEIARDSDALRQLAPAQIAFMLEVVDEYAPAAYGGLRAALRAESSRA